MQDNKADFVNRVGEMITHFMSLRGNTDTDSQALAAAVMREIQTEFKGETIYIKQGYLGTPYADSIAAEYNGQNMAEIMQRYGVSRATVYRCVNR